MPEHANTLFKGMILEGLTVVLEEKAMTDTKRQHKQYFLKTMQETDQIMIDDLISQLKGQFSDKHYDYDGIFYTGNSSLPRWAGYRLGYYLVEKYLEKTSSTIKQATFANYDDFTQ